jgi:hypothetical protein
MRIQKVISVLTGMVMMGALAVSPVASAAVDMFLSLGTGPDQYRVNHWTRYTEERSTSSPGRGAPLD